MPPDRNSNTDHNGRSKVGASEIKAVMRQAFRIVAGRYINHSSKDSIKTLLEKEGEIFGSTSRKSTFRI
ncbi:MAG: type III-B CRISPR module RAMP protein Cmr1 [Hydrogenothermaceae bacterium]|nr:type III-B CRISPR module RAMP protein Cmr1 [Hydrogenothermaceae bacterium]